MSDERIGELMRWLFELPAASDGGRCLVVVYWEGGEEYRYGAGDADEDDVTTGVCIFRCVGADYAKALGEVELVGPMVNLLNKTRRL